MENSGTQTLDFPSAGISLLRAYLSQRPLPMPSGEYGRTCRHAINCRAYEPGTGRRRGGSRSGLSRWIDTPVVQGWLIQHLGVIVGSGYPPPGGDMQTSQSGRVVTAVAISQGRLYIANAGDTSWTAVSNSTGQSTIVNFTGLIRSTSLNQKMYFVDGARYSYYDPATNTAHRWSPTNGTMPVDEDGRSARLITTWRGRIVLSGLPGDAHNWFMSAVSDPLDWNYLPETFTAASPVAGTNSNLGIVGDMITCLIAYSDDRLIFGGDHSIYMMQGDPAAGGQLDLVTNSIGMAWGEPYAMDPFGAVYFVSNQCGIYRMMPGEKPQRISQQIEQILRTYNTGEMTIRCMWNDADQGLHVFFTWTAAPAETTHFFWEMRSGAWWMDRFANKNHNPLCCVTFDGNLPDDRVCLLGSWDGVVRYFDSAATTDDGKKIESSVVIGPISTKDLDDLVFKEIQAVLGEESGDVTYEVYVGPTAEIALTRDPVKTGTWTAGRGTTSPVRRAGRALYVRLSSDEPWAMEQIRAVVAGTGRVRRRVK